MHSHYSLPLVLTSLLISILACWMALELSCRVHAQRTERDKGFWLASGAMVMGLGIWAMHYIGMLASDMGIPVSYHWPTVLLSLLAAMLSSAVALHMVSRPNLSVLRTCTGGLCMGGGIAEMHYIGMNAMRMPSLVTYDPWIVALSVVLAIAISLVALRICFAARRDTTPWSKKKLASALLMGLAVPTMHYVGMAAIHMQPLQAGAAAVDYSRSIQMSDLGVTVIIGAVVLCICFAMLLASLNRASLVVQLSLEQARTDRDLMNGYQQRLIMAYRQNGVGAWEWDPRTDTFSIDPELRKIYDIDENAGERIARAILLDRMHPDDIPTLKLRWDAALARGSHYENEYRIHHRNGKLRHCRSVATVARGADGKPVSIAGLAWDVTAEHEQQQDHADQARRFYMTLEAISDAVLSVDAQENVIYANPVACELTGWLPRECIGQPLMHVFLTEEEVTGLIRSSPVQRCIEQGGTLLSEDGILISKHGQRYNIRKHVNLIDDRGAAVITFRDTTSARRLERELQYAATHDDLTGLPNRAAFESRLQQVWDEERDAERVHCLAILDVDRFKLVNDTAGHLAGDALLREVVSVLKPRLKQNHMLARMGGDEFLLLCTDTGLEDARAFSTELLQAVQNLRFSWQNRTYDVTASLGMVFLDADSPSPEALTSQADVALFTAKRNGRNQSAAYQILQGEAANHLMEMEIAAELRSALEQDRFELYAQPIIPLHGSGKESYFELLVRLRDRGGQIVAPAQFIPAAEFYGLMHLLDRWVIHNAFATYANNPSTHPIHFAINVSAESLSDPTLWEYVDQQFRLAKIPHASITFEVTESGLIRNLNTAKNFLTQAQAAGCYIALDDFGTGMSSLSYLKQLPLDVIKIDGSFVRKLLATPLDQTIVSAIAQIARSLGAKTVGECAEDMDTVGLLDQLGVDYVQGWATGRPEPLVQVFKRFAIPLPASLDCLRPATSESGVTGLLPAPV